MSDTNDDRSCVICQGPWNSDSVQITAKGESGILAAAKQRGDELDVTAGDWVHGTCRKSYCRASSIEAHRKRQSVSMDNISPAKAPKLRSTISFNFATHCVLCGKPASLIDRREETHAVKTYTFDESIIEAARRRNDSWGREVLCRISGAPADLHAADAIYHHKCDTNFRSGRSLDGGHPTGRKVDDIRKTAFDLTMEFFERHDDEQMTMRDLIEEMKRQLQRLRLSATDVYSRTYMKTRMKEKYGDDILFITVEGQPTVATLKWTLPSILKNCKPENGDETDKRKAVLLAAARILSTDIRSIPRNDTEYPTPDDVQLDQALSYMPESLVHFLRSLLVGNVDEKVAALGHSIVQGVRPRALTVPIPFTVGVALHHNFASRFLIDSLHKLGYSCSYETVQKFQKSASVHKEDLEIPSTHCVNFIADNADHNLRTLDGTGTFHGMGIMAAVTPKLEKRSKPVPRVSVTANEIYEAGKIPILTFRPQTKESMSLVFSGPAFEPRSEAGLFDETNDDENNDVRLDLLWKVTWPLRLDRPNWNGTMQCIYNANPAPHKGEASLEILPLIDMSSSDQSCIYSTLQYVSGLARKNGITPVLTFDQPLYLSALMIQLEIPDLKDLVLRLGGLHTEMSFLGTMGHLLDGAGIRPTWSTIYSSDVLPFMISGKAISRALRAHLLTDSAITAILLSMALDIDLDDIMNDDGNVEIPLEYRAVCEVYDKIMAGDITVEAASSSKDLIELGKKLAAVSNELQGHRTARLWLQNSKCLGILRDFIRAERLGDWDLHLTTVALMIPYFAATGHINYTKSCTLYLAQMEKLAETHPTVYNHFANGLHVIRRSDRSWAGLSTDLVIEQYLMRSMKSTGGLTRRGAGFTELQRLIWVLSMPHRAEFNLALQNLTGKKQKTSEQHVEELSSRKKRDSEDARKVLQFLLDHNPFEDDEEASLRNIFTGVIAGKEVTCDKAHDAGIKILEKMDGKMVSEFSFKKADQVKNMSKTEKTVVIDGKSVQIDPMLLFQRFIISSQSDPNIDLAHIFKYELCSYPAALFDNVNFMKTSDKPQISKTIWGMYEQSGDEVPSLTDVAGSKYVVDGGFLLQKIPWKKGLSFQEICESYQAYLAKHFPGAAVVFDGYSSGPSTKDLIHLKRGANHGPKVVFTPQQQFSGKKDSFLKNENNKERFLKMLGRHLQDQGHDITHCDADADFGIVKKATELASETGLKVCIIGEDTDLLILLLYYGQEGDKLYFTSPEKPSAKREKQIWDIGSIQNCLGRELCENILFLHAILGCDATSHLLGFNKGSVIKKFMDSETFRNLAKVFAQPRATQESITDAGTKLMFGLYPSSQESDLNELRYTVFKKKTTMATSAVEPRSLPPTVAASAQHALRVYHQVQTWLGNTIDPCLWGWQLVPKHVKDEKMMIPIMTTIAIAPDILLKSIKCGCKTGCVSARCSCKKNGVPCNIACQCEGDCANCPENPAPNFDDITNDL